MGKPRFLIYFETGGEINVRPVSMGSFGNIVGELEVGKKAFERAGFELGDSMLNSDQLRTASDDELETSN
ncbi:hypothetical protein [Haladaptatus sp. DFWS20]|uniref:hypothetical protein n=1 Tax=Haladaptatus sp. DFWS20 TaxID=3403467 RepID=UPI003EBC568F